MIPRPLRSALLFVAGSVLATGLFAQAPKIDFPAPSPAGTLKQRVGLTDIEINYSRPGMKGRTVFGSLVPYDQVWRTGANTATKITFSTEVKLNGTAVPAGTYELFTIPGKTEWTVIIHKNMSQWGSYSYDARNDVARIKAAAAPSPLSVETFTIGLGDLRDESATLNFLWEKTRVAVKLEVDLVTALVPQIEAIMASEDPKKPYDRAAMFYLEHNLDLQKAAGWMETATAAQPGPFHFVLLYHKALILAKLGDKAGAMQAARQSLDLVAKMSGELKDEYTGKNNAVIAGLK